MTRSIWPALASCDALGAGIDRDRLEFVVQGELLDQGGPQLRVIVDDQDFAGIGHRFPGLPKAVAGHSPAALREVEHSGIKEQAPCNPCDKRLARQRLHRCVHKPGQRTRGWLMAGPLALPVALGRGGIRANKREGDGGTPRGTFRLRRLWWRADRAPRPRTQLPVRPHPAATTAGARTRATAITTSRSGCQPDSPATG